MLRRFFPVAVVLATLVARPASSKCAMLPYAFSGSIVRAGTGAPVAGAQVFAFLDASDRTWASGGTTRYPDFFTPGPKGTFQATAYFDTFVSYSPLGGHRCDGTATRVEFLVTRAGYLTKRVTFQLSALKATRRGDEPAFVVPPIEMEESQAAP